MADNTMIEELICISKLLKEEDGTIRTDKFGNRWIFRNGRWNAMCKLEQVKE